MLTTCLLEILKVFGFGEKKTPNPFIVACDKFIYLEILKSPSPVAATGKQKTENSQESKNETIKQIDSEIIYLISSTVNDIADEDGWAFLGDVGNLLIKKKQILTLETMVLINLLL